MERFLVNMAVVKVNWDKSGADLLDNYIPIVGYALHQSVNSIISIEDIRTEFRKVAEFEIPIAALGSLVKRAAKKFHFVSRVSDGSYEINRDVLPVASYESVRDTELRKYTQLKDAFVAFLTSQDVPIPSQEDIDSYFFEVLYDIAPSLIQRVAVRDGGARARDEHLTAHRALVARFVSHCFTRDVVSYEAIESYVRGAMLTETFYYSAPESIRGKMRDVTVYFDTAFLLRALGLCDPSLQTPCIELVEMLRGMGVKMRYFRDTFNEMHGILHAAAIQLRQGRLIPKSPGDVFDHFNSIGAKPSDAELELARLESSLAKHKIGAVDRPAHKTELTIDEVKLSEYIERFIPHQNNTSRNHDIDCLTAVFRLRGGRPQNYLESCQAIFITTNAGLARASTLYFNDHHGVSHAPVCMADQIFTTLVWMKAVRKMPDLPRHRLVANCYAAVQPSDEQWNEYIAEARTLRERGQIAEDDYAVLVHSLEARTRLMDFIIEEGEYVYGTVPEVLARARAGYTRELSDQLDRVTFEQHSQLERLEQISAATGYWTAAVLRIGLLLIWTAVLIYGLLFTAPSDLRLESFPTPKGAGFLTMVLISLGSMIFGTRLYDLSDRIARVADAKVSAWIRKLLVAK